MKATKILLTLFVGGVLVCLPGCNDAKPAADANAAPTDDSDKTG